jgi:hypothetical protein
MRRTDSNLLLGTMLAALAILPLTVGIVVEDQTLRYVAFGLCALLAVYPGLLVISWAFSVVHIDISSFSLKQHWPIKQFIDWRYGALVPLSMKHKTAAGRPYTWWLCPYDDSSIEGDPTCPACGAVFDEARHRAKRPKQFKSN